MGKEGAKEIGPVARVAWVEELLCDQSQRIVEGKWDILTVSQLVNNFDR